MGLKVITISQHWGPYAYAIKLFGAFGYTEHRCKSADGQLRNLGSEISVRYAAMGIQVHIGNAYLLWGLKYVNKAI